MQKEKVKCLGLYVDEFVVKYPFNPSGRVLYDHVFSIMFCSKSASSRQNNEEKKLNFSFTFECFDHVDYHSTVLQS